MVLRWCWATPWGSVFQALTAVRRSRRICSIGVAEPVGDAVAAGIPLGGGLGGDDLDGFGPGLSGGEVPEAFLDQDVAQRLGSVAAQR